MHLTYSSWDNCVGLSRRLSKSHTSPPMLRSAIQCVLFLLMTAPTQWWIACGCSVNGIRSKSYRNFPHLRIAVDRIANASTSLEHHPPGAMCCSSCSLRFCRKASFMYCSYAYSMSPRVCHASPTALFRACIAQGGSICCSWNNRAGGSKYTSGGVCCSSSADASCGGSGANVWRKEDRGSLRCRCALAVPPRSSKLAAADVEDAVGGSWGCAGGASSGGCGREVGRSVARDSLHADGGVCGCAKESVCADYEMPALDCNWVAAAVGGASSGGCGREVARSVARDSLRADGGGC